MVLELVNMDILIGSGITLLSVIVTNGFQIWRDRFQWQKQQELERNKWERDKVLEIYTKCISSITAYLQSEGSVTPDPSDVFRGGGITYDLGLYGQAEAWLTLLFIYHPAEETQEYIDFRKEFGALNQSPYQLRRILDTIVALARTDSRILAPTSTGSALSA